MAGGVPDGLALPLTATLMRMRGTDASPPRCAALAGEIGVAVRCRYGRPQVIASAPLRVDGKAVTHLPTAADVRSVSVFPTLYWLTCPMLQAAIGRLESAGWIARLREELEADPAAAQELDQAHRRTARMRTAMIPEATLERLRRENTELRLDNEFLGKAAAFFAAKNTPGRSASR